MSILSFRVSNMFLCMAFLLGLLLCGNPGVFWAASSETYIDTVRSVRVPIVPVAYTRAQACAIRVSTLGLTRLLALSIPVIADSGSTFRVRIVENVRGTIAPEPTALARTAIWLTAAKDGFQSLSFDCDIGLVNTSSDLFIIADSLSNRLQIVSSEPGEADECRCPEGTFAEQLVQTGNEWQTATGSFPWACIVERIRVDRDQATRYNVDWRLGKGSAGEKEFFLVSADIDDDGRTDVACPSGVFLQNSPRQFELDTAISRICRGKAFVSATQLDLGNILFQSDTLEQVQYHAVKGKRVQFRTIPTGHQRWPIAAWPAIHYEHFDGALTGKGALIVSVVCKASGQDDVLTKLTLQTWKIDANTYTLINEVMLADSARLASVVAPCVAAGEHHAGLWIVSDEGVDQLGLAVRREGARIVSRQRTTPTLIDVPGPGFTVLRDAGGRLGWPSGPTNRLQVSVGIHTGELEMIETGQQPEGWNNDKRSSLLLVDLNDDGFDDTVYCTSDTCSVLRIGLGNHSQRSKAELFALTSELSPLSGSIDLIADDFDDDGDVDLLGSHSGRLIVAWNETAGASGNARSTGMTLPTSRGVFTFTNLYRSAHSADAVAGDSHGVQLGVRRMCVRPTPVVNTCVIAVSGVAPSEPVRVDIYDQAGGHIAALHGLADPSGVVEFGWNGKNITGDNVASGRYIAICRKERADVTTSIIVKR